MRRPSKRRVFGSLVYLTLALSAAIAGCVGWAYFVEKPYLYYVNLPFPAMPAVRAGAAVELAVQRCNVSHVRRSYVTTHNLRNERSGEVVLLPDVWVDIEPGCTHSISRVNVIPKSTAPGIYTVYGVARVQGPVFWHRVPWYSRPFQVLPAEPAKEK